MRIAEGESWGARRASMALAFAVIAVAAMPLVARFAGVVIELASHMSPGRF